MISDDFKVEDDIVKISEEISSVSTVFTTIANIYKTKNPKAPPIKIEQDPEGYIIIIYYDSTGENFRTYMCNLCSQTRIPKIHLRLHKKVSHPTTTPMPEPEPPDPHLQVTQALQAQIPRILQTLGLTHI